VSDPTRSIDLNADLGEGFPDDDALLDRVTSASISCGAHAGDPDTILHTLRLAKRRGVVVGAHPGYEDRVSFGRRDQNLPAREIERLIIGQFEQLAALAMEVGLTLRFVKPHGALYNQAQRLDETAAGVAAALERLKLPVLGQPGSRLERLAHERGILFIGEGFPDRRYRPDGSLAPRSDPDAILSQPAEVEAQAVRLAEQGVATLCIHGDDPRAVANADRVRGALLRERFVLKSFA
jgi:UPF0271 protein